MSVAEYGSGRLFTLSCVGAQLPHCRPTSQAGLDIDPEEACSAKGMGLLAAGCQTTTVLGCFVDGAGNMKA